MTIAQTKRGSDSERHYSSARIMDGKYDAATFPLKKESELTPKARKWLRVSAIGSGLATGSMPLFRKRLKKLWFPTCFKGSAGLIEVSASQWQTFPVVQRTAMYSMLLFNKFQSAPCALANSATAANVRRFGDPTGHP